MTKLCERERTASPKQRTKPTSPDNRPSKCKKVMPSTEDNQYEIIDFTNDAGLSDTRKTQQERLEERQILEEGEIQEGEDILEEGEILEEEELEEGEILEEDDMAEEKDVREEEALEEWERDILELLEGPETLEEDRGGKERGLEKEEAGNERVKEDGVEEKELEDNELEDEETEAEDDFSVGEENHDSQAEEVGFEEERDDSSDESGPGSTQSEDPDTSRDCRDVEVFIDDLASITSDDGSEVEENLMPMGFYNVERILGRRGRGRFREYLIKWEGLNSADNSWISGSDFVNHNLFESYDNIHKTKRLQGKPLFRYFIVEAILSHRKGRHGREYLVKWEGYPASDNSWVEKTNFRDTEIIEEYENGLENGT